MNKKVLFSLGTMVLGFVGAIMAQPPPPQQIPIDGGLSLLIAGCVGYGAKKIYDIKKK
jgi:hypothetical protein